MTHRTDIIQRISILDEFESLPRSKRGSFGCPEEICEASFGNKISDTENSLEKSLNSLGLETFNGYYEFSFSKDILNEMNYSVSKENTRILSIKALVSH